VRVTYENHRDIGVCRLKVREYWHVDFALWVHDEKGMPKSLLSYWPKKNTPKAKDIRPRN